MQMLLGSGAAYVVKETVSASTLNYNLRTRALALGWDGLAPLAAEITVAAGVVIGSAGTAAYAFDTGTGFPAGSMLVLVNNGSIVGQGGGGGGVSASGYPQSGGAGGPALRAQVAIRIANTGVIGGGGGGGGGAAAAHYDPEGSSYDVRCAGGRGAGGGTVVSAATAGEYNSGYNVRGGGGGALGASGAAGNTGGAAGGAGGAAVVGNANITWAATGTRYGTVG